MATLGCKVERGLVVLFQLGVELESGPRLHQIYRRDCMRCWSSDPFPTAPILLHSPMNYGGACVTDLNERLHRSDVPILRREMEGRCPADGFQVDVGPV